MQSKIVTNHICPRLVRQALLAVAPPWGPATPRRPQWARPAEAIAASIRARQARAQEQAEALAAEVDWFLEANESPHKFMGVVGYSKPGSLARRMYRYGRKDLGAIYERVARLERVVA